MAAIETSYDSLVFTELGARKGRGGRNGHYFHHVEPRLTHGELGGINPRILRSSALQAKRAHGAT